MKVEELKRTHSMYDAHIKDWNFFAAAYNGGEDFIKMALHKMPRETSDNYNTRIADGICLNYSTIVIDLFSFYLTEKPSMREVGENIKNDTLWKNFLRDCDLNKTDFDYFLNEAQKVASTYGSSGILVDKADSTPANREEEVEKGIYPYCALYTLPNILDWKHQKDPKTNRPILKYLKLKDFDDTYLLWWESKWERWEIQTDERSISETAVMVNNGKNRLGEIPFTWLSNIRNPLNPYIGISDIKEISRITASLMRDISCGDEIIKYSGFPMLLMPMEDAEGKESSDIVGVTAVLEFDPEQSNSKPAWLESAIAEPIDSILKWISRKILEIFQMSHLSGVHAHEKSDQVRSGVALRYEFQQLGRVLSKKSENLTEAELNIIHFWLKWQGKEDLFEQVNISRSKEFSSDDLSEDLNNQLTALKIVPTPLFHKAIAKQVAKKVLRDTKDTAMEDVMNEIESTDFSKISTDEDSGEPMPQGDDDTPQKAGKKMSLTAWAKQEGIPYNEAYKNFAEGRLPIESERVGERIYVYPFGQK